jgi:hypothetical protein
MIESNGTGTMSGTLHGTLYYTSEQVSSHLHRRFSLEMAENARCRLSESVYVNAIDESEMINPVDHSGGFGGFAGLDLARCPKISPPKEGADGGRRPPLNPVNPAHPGPEMVGLCLAWVPHTPGTDDVIIHGGPQRRAPPRVRDPESPSGALPPSWAAAGRPPLHVASASASRET